MKARDINEEYFNWLCSLVDDSKPSNKYGYTKLLKYLYDTEFIYILPMDGNRYEDGISLRYRFGYEHNIEAPIIASCLDRDKGPCSILEMMVALAHRCEENITFNPELGIMSGKWFWMMVSNLGLGGMTDNCFDDEFVNSVIWRFLDREYSHDGEGGLIYIPNSQYDMRTTEIWYQMMRYLSLYRRNGDI